mmetsp:Transcript_11914/g.30048  ORF Transcript_11914/g.30048 Transcript_11914/m.30048 type:complete len:96 (-) Transcript_11914:598-885(-)
MTSTHRSLLQPAQPSAAPRCPAPTSTTPRPALLQLTQPFLESREPSNFRGSYTTRFSIEPLGLSGYRVTSSRAALLLCVVLRRAASRGPAPRSPG